MKPKSIELYIEQLQLEGFSPGDRYRIGVAVERELMRILGEKGLPSSLSRQTHHHQNHTAAKMSLGSNPPAETVGAQVARAIYGGFGK